MNIVEWTAALENEAGRTLLAGLYGDDAVDEQRVRYKKLIELLSAQDAALKAALKQDALPIRIFTAAGRTELGGNHTDHNCGKVLAASVQLDAVAAVMPRSDKKVFFRSTGFPDVVIDISELAPVYDEKGASEAILRGIASGIAERGIAIGGWTAVADSTVMPGSGLSSSAALGVLAAKIFDSLYGQGGLSPLALAQIAQKAENDFYGKPSGLMDEAASAQGGAIYIDFENADSPIMRRFDFDPCRAGYVLCVVNTGGSHSDFTAYYAAVPQEMRKAAAVFGKKNLRAVGSEAFSAALSDPALALELRKKCGDRAILRALHFFSENVCVDLMTKEIEAMNLAKSKSETAAVFERFLKHVNESGQSSWELLQNCYPHDKPQEQGIPLALALSRGFAQKTGIKIGCRVHGGGFAGTIQAYIPETHFDSYRAEIEAVFGASSLTRLSIRATGAAELAL